MEKSSNLLPKISEAFASGGVYVQMVRCGKPACRCSAAGGSRHRAYYFLGRTGGKQMKIYIRRADVPEVRRMVEARRRTRRERATLLSAGLDGWRTLRDRVREYESQISTAKEPKTNAS
jgi:hypothetical protein